MCDFQMMQNGRLTLISRILTWANIIVQVLFPLAAVFTPVMAARADDVALSTGRVRPYTLSSGETVHSVARRYHLTVAQLKKLNQFRTFSRPFEQLHAGDEIDVPVLPPVEGKPAAENLTKVTPDQTGEVERWLAGQTSSLAQATTGRHHAQMGEAATSQARSAAVSGSEAAVSAWLNQFGTARVQLGVDDHFALNESALDMLVPLYDNGRDVLFTQFGGRRHDDRTTLNLGAGVRLFRGDWMYGMNAFLDNDITGHNRRVGVGGEAWTDYLKLAANGYLGMTDWHQSRDFEDYDERPANGFDVTANAWLPAYPQLGAKLKYEQYQGDQVGLLSRDTRQKNPKAVTAGLEWTPVPLLTLGTDYHNSGGHDELQMQAQFTWRMGASLKEQLSGDNVAASRTLAGSRLDLVERNNNIVLEYRKQDVIRLALPENMHGQGGSSLLLTATVNAKHGLAGIDWSAPELVAAGGSITPAGTQGLQVMLPPYSAGGANQYVIHAQARDTRDNVSPEAQTLIQVDGAGISASRSSLTLSLNSLPADGSSTSLITLTLRDGQGNPVPGMAPFIALPVTFVPFTIVMNRTVQPESLKGRLWDVLTSPLGATAMAAVQPVATGGVRISALKETSPGVYTALLTAGTQAGTVTLTPQIDGQIFPSASLKVGTDVSALLPGVPVPPVTPPLADGQPVHLRVPITGADGNPAPNQTIKIYVDGHPITIPVDKNGNADVPMPGQVVPGNHDYLMELNGHRQTVSITFTPALVSAAKSELVVETVAPVAHSPVTVRLKLKDARGQLMKGETGLTLTGSEAGTAPVFGEDAKNPGEYTATFTPVDAKVYTLGVAGLNGFTKTVGVTVTAATSGHTLAKPADVTVVLGDASPAAKVVSPVNGGTVSYSSSDATKVAVDAATGELEIHAVTAGTPVTITATEAAAGYTNLTTGYTVTVNPALVSAAKSELVVETVAPVAHSPVTVRLKLKDARGQLMKGETGLTLTGSEAGTAPVFGEDAKNPGEYTATFTPVDAKAYTLGVTGLNGFTKTVGVTVTAATSGHTLAKPADVTVVLGDASPAAKVVSPVNGGTVSYVSSDKTKVAVDAATGELEIHAVTAGTPVTITAKETAAGYTDLTTGYTVTVNPALVSAAKSELVVETVAPVAHSPVTVRLKLKDARGQMMKGETGLTLTGSEAGTAPVFGEDAKNTGEYTATFTPVDAKAYTLGVAGLNGFTKTVGVTVIAGAAPVVANVALDSNSPQVGDTLTVSYTYSDANNDVEGATTFAWYRDGKAIRSATGRTYTLEVVDENHIISAGVTPVSATGTPAQGAEERSTGTSPVKPKSGTAPVVTNAYITSVPTPSGYKLTAHYIYNDADGDAEGATEFQWLKNGSMLPDTTATIDDVSGNNGYIVIITPVSATGSPNRGLQVTSSRIVIPPKP